VNFRDNFIRLQFTPFLRENFIDCMEKKMSWLIDNFKKFDKKIAIIHNDIKYTYIDLYRKIQEYLDFFKNNIKQGEVVAILGDHSFENIALLFALYQNKNIIVPIASKNQNEIKEKLTEAYCDKTVKVNDNKIILDILKSCKKHKLIENLQLRKQSGLILFSSGSTGKPKAMIHNFDNLVDHYKGKKEKNINTMIFLIFDHIGGIDTLLRQLSIGGICSIPQNRHPQVVCSMIEKYKINVLPASPTFLNLLIVSHLYKEYDLSSLQIIAFGAEPMPEVLLRKLNEIFPNVKLHQKFGTSETNAIRVINKSNDSLFIRIDDPALEYKIVNGELWLKSKTQIMGYLNAPMDSFTDDGWFKTGDLVEVTDDGYIRIIGRSKEMINVGGEKVLPAEVESVILEIPEVVDCMVYGETNAITGQTVIADVVLNKLIDKYKAKKIIRKYCRSKLENYKVPTKINFVEKTNFGDRFKKIRRKEK
jgi:acyl-CoA synthetase (AMP-forming)/AMP-acid ligase II